MMNQPRNNGHDPLDLRVAKIPVGADPSGDGEDFSPRGERGRTSK